MKISSLAISAAMAAWLLAPATVQAQTPQRLKIGGLFSMTGGGSVISFSGLAGAKLAIQEINAAGGIMGRQVDLIVSDDGSDATLASNEAKRLVFQEKIELAIGPIGSLTTMAVMPVLTENKIATISIAQTSKLTPQFAPYNFTEVASSEASTRIYVDGAIDMFNAKKLALLTDNTQGSKASQVEIAAYAKTRNIPITITEEFEANAPDLTANLLSVRRSNPDVILHTSLSARDAGQTIKAMDEIGYKIPIIFSTSAAAGFPAVAAVSGEALANADNVFAWDYKTLSYCPNDPVGSAPVSKFLERAKAAIGPDWAKMSSTNVAWLYDGIMILKAAAEGAGSTEGPKIAAWMEKNSAQAPSVLGVPEADNTSHFLLKEKSLTIVGHLGQTRSDGLRKRAAC